jgi:hypothetical protein
MIDTNWLLWCHAFLGYTIRRVQHATIRKLGYTIAGMVLALTVGPLFVIGVYTIITSLVGR